MSKNPILPTLMLVIVIFIAAACVAVAVVEPKELKEADRVHTTTASVVTQTEPTTEKLVGIDESLMILVNAWNPLPEGYEPELVSLNDWPLSVAQVAYSDLQEMLMDGMAEGLHFQICSAYRSVEEQEALFNEDVQRYLAQGMSQAMAEAEANQYTQRPRCSEHHTGLAVDIVSTDYQLLDAGQEKTPETQWLHDHCHEYGFILRYPKGAEDVTGVSYESWHYRYVGREAAALLTEENMTLEAYWSSYKDY